MAAQVERQRITEPTNETDTRHRAWWRPRFSLAMLALAGATTAFPAAAQYLSPDAVTTNQEITLVGTAHVPLYDKPLTLHGFYYTCGRMVGAMAPGEAWTVEGKTTVPTFLGRETWVALEHEPDDTVGWIDLDSAKVRVMPAEKHGDAGR